jgi:ATP-dependent DNA ligase
MNPIIPIVRKDSFDDPDWIFELKYDGFRGIADTMQGRVLSKRGNHLKRFDVLLRELPSGCIFDGEIVALDLCALQKNVELSGENPNFHVLWPILLNITKRRSVA